MMLLLPLALGFALSPAWADISAVTEEQKNDIMAHIRAGLVARENFLAAEAEEANQRSELLERLADYGNADPLFREWSVPLDKQQNGAKQDDKMSLGSLLIPTTI